MLFIHEALCLQLRTPLDGLSVEPDTIDTGEAQEVRIGMGES